MFDKVGAVAGIIRCRKLGVVQFVTSQLRLWTIRRVQKNNSCCKAETRDLDIHFLIGRLEVAVEDEIGNCLYH
jgi:hypothetical protein